LTVTNHGIFNLIVNDDVARMDFNPEGSRYPNDLINSSFKREVRYLLRLQYFKWSPEILSIDYERRTIDFKWYGNTCEDFLPNDYDKQLEIITQDLCLEQIYKPSFYPKYFYTDNKNKIHAYAFYSSSDFSEQPISMDFYRPILNPQRAELVSRLEKNGSLDMGVLVKCAFTDYIKWPGDPLPEIYRKTYQSLSSSHTSV
jgi:hypothetical protein